MDVQIPVSVETTVISTDVIEWLQCDRYTVVLEPLQYGGRDLKNWSQWGGASARRGVRVYKKFLHREFFNVLNCGLAWST